MRKITRIGGLQPISRDTDNNGEMDEQNELMRDLLFTVHQLGGDDVT